jgi:monoamine oxidase
LGAPLPIVLDVANQARSFEGSLGLADEHPVKTVDVVVAGAGIAGLVAARRLEAMGRRVVVLEARDRVGGRTFNEATSDGTPQEMGGQYVGPTQDAVLALARELGVATYATYDEGEHLYLRRGRIRRYKGTIPPVPVQALADYAWVQRKLERLASTVPLDAPWTAPHARLLDAKTLGGWMDDHFHATVAREMADVGARAVWTCDSDEVSLLHALFYLRSGGMLDRLLAVRDGAQQDRLVGGSQELSLRMARALSEPVRLSCPARRIRSDTAGVVVETDGETMQASFAVVTAQPALAARIAFEPALPALHAHLLDRLTGTPALKMMAVYPEPFWRREGLSGQSASDTTPYQVTFDNSPPSGRPGVLMTFAEGRHALELRQRTKEERRLLYIQHLARLFGQAALGSTEYLEHDWAGDPWSRGCLSHLPPGALTAAGRSLREPHGRVHFAGSERATRWAGYMDGAVRSGEAVAEALGALLVDQSS